MVPYWLMVMYSRDADIVWIPKKEQLNPPQLNFDAASSLVIYGDLTKKKVGRLTSLYGIETVAKREKRVHADASHC